MQVSPAVPPPSQPLSPDRTARSRPNPLRLLAQVLQTTLQHPRPIFWPAKPSYVLILSHMRSRSTLLSHLLGSHPEIAGYCEHGVSYRALPLALVKLRLKVCWNGGYRPTAHYFLDKVLHDQFRVPAALRNRANVRIVFLLRPAAATLRSIMRMVESVEGRQASAAGAAKYYVQRLRTLREYARTTDQALTVDSDSLIDDPKPVLRALQAFLGLAKPFSETYRRFPRTGVAGFGDPSAMIRSGTILQAPPTRDPAQIDPDALEKAAEAYDDLRSVLASRFPVAGVEAGPREPR